MNSRERVMTALSHREPDRVPIDITITVDTYNELKEYLGIKIDEQPSLGRWTDVKMHPDVIQALGIDFVHVSGRSVPNIHTKTLPDGFVDEWGLKWRRVENVSGHFYFEMYDPPLKDATVDDVEKYVFPDPTDPRRVEGLEEQLRYLYEKTDLAITAKFAEAVFELATYLRGHNKWYADLIINRDFAEALMSRLLKIQMGINETCLKVAGKYIQILRLSGEDLGMQDRPLLSPKIFREVVKPYLKQLWTHAKETLLMYNPQGKTMLHSCGDVYPFIEDIIECGVDILDPVQPRAAEMDHFRLKREFGDRICFHGGIDTQYVLPFGTPEEVEQEVKRAISALGPGGGYIVAPVHNVQGDVPARNLVAMVEAAKKYGTYPLNL